jgi:hypothetical protein
MQMLVRAHRGRLTRRSANIGNSVEHRSVLVTASFGSVHVSREFALGK